MLGFGPPADRQARRQWWHRQIERQQHSRLSVAQFCHRYDLNPVTFYSWRRRFAIEAAGLTSPPPSSPTPRPPASFAPAFVPVSIATPPATGQLEIELGDAVILRLHGHVDPGLLRTAIRAVARIGRTQSGGH
jgi:transposase-like protein